MTQADYEALAQLRYLLRCFMRFSEEKAEQAQLTHQQHQALLALKGFPGGAQRATIGELAERLQIRPHSAVGLVDRLVIQGLVRRESATSDRRQVFVSLSQLGEARLESLSEVHRQELQRIGPEIGASLNRIMQDIPRRP